MQEKRLIIADDHQVVRQGVRNIFEKAGGLKVIAEAADGAEAERLAEELDADLLILDISLPIKSGIQVFESLRAKGSRLPILFFTMHPLSQYADYAKRRGAQGFVSKDTDTQELLGAIWRILNGGTNFPRQAVKNPRLPTADPFSLLSRREAEVMHGLLCGNSLQEIATHLGIGSKSISTYRRRLLDKLGVGSNTELAALAAHYGHL